MERIRLAAEPARKLTESLRWSTSDTEERAYWFTRLEEQVQSMDPIFRSLFAMGGRSVGSSRRVSVVRWEKARYWQRRRLLRHLPSWGELARGETDVLRDILRGRRRMKTAAAATSAAWMADLRAEL